MWERELIEAVNGLREDVQDIRVELRVMKVRVGLWSMFVTAIPIVTAVVLAYMASDH